MYSHAGRRSIETDVDYRENIFFDHTRSKSFNISRTYTQTFNTGFRPWDFSSPSDFIEGKSSEQIFSSKTSNPTKSAELWQHVSKYYEKLKYNDYATKYPSALAHFSILEVDPNGKFIRLYNSEGKEMEIGNHIIQQNFEGEPIVIFKFPSQAKFPRNSIMTVWASSTHTDINNQSPLDYLFKEQPSWATESDVTTILCNPKGQAIAWTNPFMKTSKMTLKKSLHETIPDTEEVQTVEPEMDKIVSKKSTKVTANKRARPKVTWNVNHIKHPYGLPSGHDCHPCSELKEVKELPVSTVRNRNASIFSLISKCRIKNSAMIARASCNSVSQNFECSKVPDNFLKCEIYSTSSKAFLNSLAYLCWFHIITKERIETKNKKKKIRETLPNPRKSLFLFYVL
ncbi:lamin tail domain-containing protein 1-like isoform X2 [Octopus sinensis]|uniref:Lamin tail domain-containing protein 1-like isoform X2 n=1 Tax=Octopus sinensis TaxID=2607531 RepID=A0A7E6F5S8_9MOLL|nr:lamin tail domain-containing protein 1-like isoform X2 [Octopus sinensis]